MKKNNFYLEIPEKEYYERLRKKAVQISDSEKERIVKALPAMCRIDIFGKGFLITLPNGSEIRVHGINDEWFLLFYDKKHFKCDQRDGLHYFLSSVTLP